MSIVPLQLGGWWHDYVCPTHGTELEAERGGIYPCRHGCELTGEPYAAAWLVYQHQALAREAHFLARSIQLGQTGETPTRAHQILNEYATLYAQVSHSGWNEGSEEWMLKGKLFSQALSEAQWAVQMSNAVISLNESENTAKVALPVVRMLQGLLETVVAAREILVSERNDERSNYTAWLNTAGLSLSRALQSSGESADIQKWVQWSFQHVRIAVKDDGWEWEGSTYYHLFVLRAYLLGLRGMVPSEIPADVRDRLAAMVGVLAAIAAPNGQLPILHDGPYDRVPMHREVLEIQVLAEQLFTETGLGPVGAFARNKLGGSGRPALEDLLSGWFSADPIDGVTTTRGSVYFPDVGYGILRDGNDHFQAILDAGPHGGSHGHFDKLALYFYGDEPWQPAPGVPPYGSPLRRGHYAQTTAHPTVRVDGKDQAEGIGRVEFWDAADCRIVAHADDVFPGVRLKRDVMMSGSLLIDIVHVSSLDDLAHDISLALRPAVGVRLETFADVTTSHWVRQVDDSEGVTMGLTGFHRASVPAALVTTPGRGPSDDPAAIVPVADWHAHAKQATFVSVYSFDPADHPSHVEITFTDNDVASIQIASSANELTTLEVHQ